MLNTTILKPTSNVPLNTPATGIIQKSANGSFFIKFHHTSERAQEIFSDNPRYKGKQVSILQYC